MIYLFQVCLEDIFGLTTFLSFKARLGQIRHKVRAGPSAFCPNQKKL